MSSVKMDWQTPKEVWELLYKLSPEIYDPCPAHWKQGDPDALEESWRVQALTYVNPPYGRSLPLWTRKGAWEFRDVEAKGDEQLVMLVPARPDTKWWQTYVVTADVICFWKGRLKFVGAQFPAPFPSAFAYWGNHQERFVKVFGEKGWCVTP